MLDILQATTVGVISKKTDTRLNETSFQHAENECQKVAG